MKLQPLIEGGNKPKVLPPLDHEKIANELATHVKKMYRRDGINVGDDHDYHHDKQSGIHHISVEHNGGGDGSNMRDMIRDKNHKNVEIVDYDHHEGHYDWPSDTYRRPYSTVSYKLIR